MKNILLLSVTLASFVSCQKDCSSDDCDIPNLGAAMLGYDPGISDPFNTRGDPGLRQEIFSPTSKKSQSYIRHAFISKALEEYRCHGQFSSTSIKSYSDYMKEKSTDIEWDVGGSVEASGSFMGFSAEVSASYKYSESTHDLSVRKFFQEIQGEMEQATSVCQTHIVEKSTIVEPVLTTGFKRFLVEIDKVAKSNDDLLKDRIFIQFIESYGTHYQLTTKLGAKLIFQRMYESRAQSTSERNERSKCAKNEAEGCVGGGYEGAFSAKVCASGSHQECKASIDESSQLENRGYESKRVLTIGSAPASTIDSWGSQVGKVGGVILGLKLQKITNLFTQQIFGANDITTETGEQLNPQLMATFINDRMARYCQLILGKECPEQLLGCGIMGSCGDNEKCIPDNTQQHGYRCQVKVTPEEKQTCKEECSKKSSTFYSKCGLYSTTHYGSHYFSWEHFSYKVYDYGSRDQCKVSLDASCEAQCENQQNYEGMMEKVDLEVKNIEGRIQQGNENILKNVKTLQEKQIQLMSGQLDLKENQMKVLQNQFQLLTGQEIIKSNITDIISNQLISKMNQANLLQGQSNLTAGQFALNSGQKAIRSNQVKIMLDQEQWFKILSKSQKELLTNQLEMLVNQDILMEGQEHITSKLIETSSQILTNQESWFTILNTQQQELLYGQTRMSFNQMTILRDTKEIMANLEQLQATVDIVRLEVKYNTELNNIKSIQYWFNSIKEGPYGTMDLDFHSENFKKAALHFSTGIQKSLLILNEMLTGGRGGIAAKTIYETNKQSFCNTRTFEYFNNLLSTSSFLLNIATIMDGRTLLKEEITELKKYKINHESQYLLNCGCNAGFRRGARIDLKSFVSTLNENLPLRSRNQVFQEILSLNENDLMAKKMLVLQKHFNFNLNNDIKELIRRTSIEDIETIVQVSITSPNPPEDLELLSEKFTCYKSEEHPLKSSPTDIVILGGYNNFGVSMAVTSISMSTAFCKPVPNLPAFSSYHAATIWKHKYLLSCGGIDNTKLSVDTCYTLDLNDTQSNIWSQDHVRLPKKAAAHTLNSLGTPDGSVAFTGGAESRSKILDTTYKLQGNQWLPGPQMKTVRWKHCAAMTGTDTIIVTGGHDALTKLNTVEMIDFATKTTTSLPPMNQAREYHGCSTANTPNGKVLVVAGGKTNTVEMLELSWSARAWTTITALPNIRSMCTLVPTPDMEGLRVIGGTDENNAYLTSILQMRPFSSSGTWETVPGVTMVRKKHAGVVLPFCRK